jgi:hypothetical protein
MDVVQRRDAHYPPKLVRTTAITKNLDIPTAPTTKTKSKDIDPPVANAA